MTCTLTSSEVHRILTTEPERSAAGEHGRSHTACRHDFPATHAPSSDTKAGDSGAPILQMVSPCADGQRPSSLIGPAPRQNEAFGAVPEMRLQAPETAHNRSL